MGRTEKDYGLAGVRIWRLEERCTLIRFTTGCRPTMVLAVIGRTMGTSRDDRQGAPINTPTRGRRCHGENDRCLHEMCELRIVAHMHAQSDDISFLFSHGVNGSVWHV